MEKAKDRLLSMFHIVRLIDYKTILGPYTFQKGSAKDCVVYAKNRIFHNEAVRTLLLDQDRILLGLDPIF